MANPQKWRIELTPLKLEDSYGATFDVSNEVIYGSVSEISQQVDDGDFDLGVFTFGYLNLKVSNVSGRYSDIQDCRSIFNYSRDRAKIEIIYIDEEETETTFFIGYIAEEFTTQDLDNGTVSFKILSQDSIFRKLIVPVGTLQNGSTVSELLDVLFDRPSITNFLNYSPADINPAYNAVVDDISGLENKSYKEVLDILMVISGSILLVNRDQDIIVKDRAVNPDIYYHFYSTFDAPERRNIIAIKNFNTGSQRAFNSFSINTTNIQNSYSIGLFGLRKKDLGVQSYVTNLTTQEEICQYYADNFSYPKVEFELAVKTKEALEINLLDTITLNYDPSVKSRNGEPLPLYGSAEYGKFLYPIELAERKIFDNIGYKVIGIATSLDNLVTILKVREVGLSNSDSPLSYWTDEDGVILVDDDFSRFFLNY